MKSANVGRPGDAGYSRAWFQLHFAFGRGLSSRYILKQKLLSLRDDFFIPDENERDVYFVDGQFLSIRRSAFVSGAFLPRRRSAKVN